jgi:4-cresol dehydrogenase (hydroxylating)
VDDAALSSVLDSVESVIGRENVSRLDRGSLQRAEQRRNISHFRRRELEAVLQPSSVDHVREIVRLFNERHTGVKLHVVGTGRNWGLGSGEPASDGVVTLDLRRLARQRSIDIERGWAIVEPGVTQASLAAALAGTCRMLNVTASSGHTSIVGNALDRGVGLRRQRTDDLAGLEVILPTGELIYVGWWPEGNEGSACYPHGLGPSLLPLFLQSNLGIVTAAAIKLMPRPETSIVIRLSFQVSNLAPVVAELRRWMSQELISGVIKIYDSVSTMSYGGRAGDQQAFVCISGAGHRVDTIAEILSREAEQSSVFSEVSRSDQFPSADDDIVGQVLEQGYVGNPVHNERMLQAATGGQAEQVDRSGNGWIFFLPFIPFTPQAVGEAYGIIEQIDRDTGIRAGTTVNAVSPDLVDLVVSIRFSPAQNDVETAHAALDLIYKRFKEKQFHPYRLDIDHAGWRDGLEFESSELALTRRISQLLDPNAVMAPGRYG